MEQCICSDGGCIPIGDMGWKQCIDADKELTMWDVVVEMILVARGKVTVLASGNLTQISWISSHFIEQAWKEMAQTLTETNSIDTRAILEFEPSKWLPNRSVPSCMLCGVHFYPIMCTRHHCRFCGGIFCGECTKRRSLLPQKFRTRDPQRVYDVCCVRLESVQIYLMDQIVSFRKEKRIPESIVLNASGLAILTVVKVGMMVTYKVGTGLVVAQREDGSWSPPSTISYFGLG